MGKISGADLTLADLSELMHKVSDAASSEAVFSAVAGAAGTFIGHRLFTIMAFDAEAMQVRRLYSSNPQAYPPSGIKDKRDTQWGRHVLERGRPFIGRNAEDIRSNFDDHEVILGLGLGSVLNVPIRIWGQTIGTMNLLHQTEFYSTADLERGFIFAGLLVGPLCAKPFGYRHQPVRGA